MTLAILGIVILFAIIGLVFIFNSEPTVTGRGYDAAMFTGPPDVPSRYWAQNDETYEEYMARMEKTGLEQSIYNQGRYRPNSRSVYDNSAVASYPIGVR